MPRAGIWIASGPEYDGLRAIHSHQRADAPRNDDAGSLAPAVRHHAENMSQTPSSPPPTAPPDRGGVSGTWAQCLALTVGVLIAVGFEIVRLQDRTSPTQNWLADINVDTSPFLVLFALLPLCWWPFHLRRSRGGRRQPEAGQGSNRELCVAWSQCLLIGIISLWVSHSIGQRTVGNTGRTFGNLPPAYHDEYSYLFQAHTFADGRLAYPSHPRLPQVFDQMHVINEGQFASRYFPSTGLWMWPFVRWGHPVWGHWLAGAVSAMLLFWTGRCLGGPLVGLVSGLLCAVSPGIGLFSNLLLAHHPTLMGLSLFLWGMTRVIRCPHAGWALVAGSGLSFAMLARPMAAAGCGLPFGIWTLIWLVRGRTQSEPIAGDSRPAAQPDSLQRRLLVVAALGLPLIAGLGFQFHYNQRITGNGWTTPYQLYTDIYTPRHVYGFNNVVRGERHLGPKVIDAYDRWAENLTPALATRNLAWRLIASWQWTLGIIPLAMGSVVFVLRTPRCATAWWLIAAALLCLHLVHIPYWYVGIMNWHYVFETSLLWCLVFAGATQRVWSDWRHQGRSLMQVWWCGLVSAALLPGYVALPPFWSSSRLQVAVEMVSFSRMQYDRFQRVLEPLRRDIQYSGTPALVLIDADHADTHIDYVNNHPALTADILIGRYNPAVSGMAELQRGFPRRSIYVYDPGSGRLRSLTADSNSD